MLDIGEESVVRLEPQLEVVDDTLYHGEFAVVSVGQVYLDMVLADVWIYPGENVFLGRQEDHILIDHEETIGLRKSKTGGHDLAGKLVTPFGAVSLLQARDGLVLEVVSPDLLSVRLRLAKDNLGGAWNGPLLSFLIEIPFFF